MDNIYSSHHELEFPPDAARPGLTFKDLPLEDIDALISEHQAKILEYEASIMRYRQLITRHHEAMARYRTCRNERTALINRILPVEVFSEILLQYSFISRRDTGYYSWLKAGHVCRSWRNVVRSMPQLFSYIRLPVISRSHLEEFIRASGQIPLHITAGRDFMPDGDSSGETLEKLLPRTQTLRLLSSPAEAFIRHIKWPVYHALTSLVWTYRQEDLRYYSKPWPRGISGIMPNLQSLDIEIKILGADWLQNPLPPSLMTLKLRHDHIARPQGTMADLIRRLSSTTSLQNIEFTGLRSDDYPSEPNVSTGGEILHLKSLYLSSSIAPIFAFLRRFRVVDNVHLTMTADLRPRELWSLPPMLRTKLPPIQSTEKSSIRLNLDAASSLSVYIKLTIWVSPERSDKVPLTIPQVHLSLPTLSLTEALGFFEAFSNDLPDHFIRAKHLILALSGQEYQPISLVQNILWQLCNITHLIMELPSPDHWRGATLLVEFPSVLAPCDNENQEPVVLPNMRSLRINANGCDHLVFEAFYLNILGALRRRGDAYGLRLRTLELVVPSIYVPFVDEHRSDWQDIVDNPVITIAE